jgi:hypothetical protein
MASTSSRPQRPRSLSQEEAQASTSTTERTPLLSSQLSKADHRFLGVAVPLWLPRRYIAMFLAFMGMMVVLLVSALFIDPIWRRRQSVFMSNGTHDFRKTVVVISFDGFRYVPCCLAHRKAHITSDSAPTTFSVDSHPISLLRATLDFVLAGCNLRSR